MRTPLVIIIPPAIKFFTKFFFEINIVCLRTPYTTVKPPRCEFGKERPLGNLCLKLPFQF